MSSDEKKPTQNLSARAIRLLGAAARSRSGSILRARHASVLLAHDQGASVADIARALRTGTRSVESFLDREIQIEKGDARQAPPKRGLERGVTPEAEAWLVELACQAPGHYGYSATRWTIALIIQHLRGHSRAAGHAGLARMERRAVCELLDRHGACPSS